MAAGPPLFSSLLTALATLGEYAPGSAVIAFDSETQPMPKK
jgi:hypothetical protein